jgi:hypothetical protein
VIEIQPSLDVPSGGATLWHYMSLEKYLGLVTSETLWFSRLDMLSDAFEGSVNEATLEDYRRQLLNPGVQSLPNAPELAKRAAEAFRLQACASCWHVCETETALMWFGYARPPGVAIRTTFDRLVRAFEYSHDLVFPGLVRYLDYSVDAIRLELQAPAAFSKRIQFYAEAELRLLWWSNAAVNRAIWEGTTDVDAASQYPVRNWPDAGKPIRVDLQSLFAEVVVHSGGQSWVVNAVAATTKSHVGASVPVRPSILDDRPSG